MTHNNNKILMMIDALIDTRYGTLRRYWPEVVDDIMENDYYDRKCDAWVKYGVTYEDFKARYENRDIDTLKEGFVAYIAPILNDAINEVLDAKETIPIVGDLTITINTYPYSNLPDEASRAIAGSLSSILGGRAAIDITYIPYEDMTFKNIKQSYGVLAIYDLNEWLVVQKDTISKESMPTVQVLSPALYNQPIDKKESDILDVHPFVETEVEMAQSFRLCLQSPRYFSAVVV